jgi:hypothetical protein
MGGERGGWSEEAGPSFGPHSPADFEGTPHGRHPSDGEWVGPFREWGGREEGTCAPASLRGAAHAGGWVAGGVSGGGLEAPGSAVAGSGALQAYMRTHVSSGPKTGEKLNGVFANKTRRIIKIAGG